MIRAALIATTALFLASSPSFAQQADPTPTSASVTATGPLMAPFLVGGSYQSVHYFLNVPAGGVVQTQECQSTTPSSCSAVNGLVRSPATGPSSIQSSISGGASGVATGVDVPRGEAPYHRILVTVLPSGTVTVNYNPSYVGVTYPGAISVPNLEAAIGTPSDPASASGSLESMTRFLSSAVRVNDAGNSSTAPRLQSNDFSAPGILTVLGTLTDVSATNSTGSWSGDSLWKGIWAQVAQSALASRANDTVSTAAAPRVQVHDDVAASGVRINDTASAASTPRYQTHDDYIVQVARANDTSTTIRLQVHDDITSLGVRINDLASAALTPRYQSHDDTLANHATAPINVFSRPYTAAAAACATTTVGTTPTVVLAAGTTRNGLGVQVPYAAANSIFYSWGNTPTTTPGGTTFEAKPGGTISFAGAPNVALNAIATASTTISCQAF